MNDLARAAELIAKTRRLAILTGAGVSAESGVPTFRGPNGFWRGRDPQTLATPEAFAADPKTVWEFYNARRARLRHVQPNPAHFAIAALAENLPDVTVVTQNVDRLHQRAGSRNVVEIHGNIEDVRCSRCGRVENKTGDELPPLPVCPACGGLFRPAVVWFGEELPLDAWTNAQRAVERAETLLVVGTSALVYPAAGLIRLAHNPDQSIIEINPEPTPFSATVTISIPGKAGEILPRLVPASPTA